MSFHVSRSPIVCDRVMLSSVFSRLIALQTFVNKPHVWSSFQAPIPVIVKHFPCISLELQAMLLELSQLIIVRSKCQQSASRQCPKPSNITISQKRPSLHLSDRAAYYANAHVKLVESA